MEIPEYLKPTNCVRCGHDIEYEFKKIVFLSDSNELIIPAVCLNPHCGIKFKVHYKFEKWEYM